MNLSNIIRKYEKELIAEDKSEEGKYVDGKWVPPAVIDRQFKGTIIPFNGEELQMYEAGTYTTEDRKLYIVSDLKDINGIALNLFQGQIIKNGQAKFEIKQSLDACEIAGFEKFLLKKVINDDQS